MNKKVSPKTIMKNGGLFIGLILLTVYIIFKNNDVKDIANAISRVNMYYILIGIICSTSFMICEGINMK